MSVPVVPALIGSLLSWPVKEAAKVGLSATSAWIVAGAQAILAEVVKVITLVSTPSLTASWFSASYWRIAGLAMLLTVPFLFAAAVQAVIRTDLGVLIRAAFVDLPIAVLAVTLTAPVVALLLAATDEMCAVVTGGGAAGGSFLTATGTDLGTMRSSCMLAVIAVVILLAGLVLMVELIMRSAAIYIVVLFLPLGFAAMVWPARRIWIKRMVELLIALILSKFAMVAILSLAVTGLASLGSTPSSVTTAMTAMALMVLAAFSPWALLRLLPFTEIAASAASGLSQETRDAANRGVQKGRRTAAWATEPMAAGADALRRLIQDDGDGSANGVPLLRTGDGQADRPRDRGAGSSPGGAGSPAGGAEAPSPGTAPGPRPGGKPPLAELSPIFRRDNERMEVNLSGDGSAWLVSSEDASGQPPEVGETGPAGPGEGGA